MSDGTLERNRAEKALIITNKTPAHCQFFKNSGVKNYSDKNGNEVIKSDNKNRRTFAFWALVVLIFIFGLGNLALTCTMLFVIRLGKGHRSSRILNIRSILAMHCNAVVH
uniref:SFRICE_016099 n=1 Tax=Spodoptera frugiperda TaxID=7108 RepID=A0A2H1VM70_SPOFR